MLRAVLVAGSHVSVAPVGAVRSCTWWKGRLRSLDAEHVARVQHFFSSTQKTPPRRMQMISHRRAGEKSRPTHKKSENKLSDDEIRRMLNGNNNPITIDSVKGVPYHNPLSPQEEAYYSSLSDEQIRQLTERAIAVTDDLPEDTSEEIPAQEISAEPARAMPSEKEKLQSTAKNKSNNSKNANSSRLLYYDPDSNSAPENSKTTAAAAITAVNSTTSNAKQNTKASRDAQSPFVATDEKKKNKNKKQMEQQMKDGKTKRSSDGAMWMQWDDPVKKAKQRLELAFGRWEDSFVVLNKPAGIPVEDLTNPSTDTVASRMRSTFQDLRLHKDHIIFPHRLDKWASGLQVVAFDTLTASRLQNSMKAGKWHKRYRMLVQMPDCILRRLRKDTTAASADALVEDARGDRNCSLASPALEGSMMHKGELVAKGKLFSFIAPQRRDNVPEIPPATGCAACRGLLSYRQHHPFVVRHLLYRSVPHGAPEGRSSSTCFIFRFANLENGVALYEAVPQTGRTHQLRIHFADAGFPILGDPYYNPYFADFLRYKNDSYTLREFITSPTQMTLQSSLLHFLHPFKDEEVKLELPDPPLWRKLLGEKFDPEMHKLRASKEDVAAILNAARRKPGSAEDQQQPSAPKPPVLPAARFAAFIKSLKDVQDNLRAKPPAEEQQPYSAKPVAGVIHKVSRESVAVAQAAPPQGVAMKQSSYRGKYARRPKTMYKSGSTHQ